MIKVSDYIANYLKNEGITHVFAITGGASAHLIDSIAKCEGIEYICNQHEQASAMAADGYARESGKIGVAIATSGPGATNLLTGCCTSYHDSVPVLMLTGQVASNRVKGNLQIRQMSTQETDTTDIFKSVTKYCAFVNCPDKIRYELEKAVIIARDGRKGAVLLDIPDDFQRTIIDEQNLVSFFDSDEYKSFDMHGAKEFNIDVNFLNDILMQSRRPIIIAGRGVHIADAESEFLALAEKFDIPCLFTWGGQ